MNTSEIFLYQNTAGDIKHKVRLSEIFIYPNENLMNFSKHLTINYQHIINFLTNIYTFLFAKSKNCHTFDINNTCHASHLNSAPGQVFAFYRLLVFKIFISKAYALQ
jgi:hypothetical protein